MVLSHELAHVVLGHRLDTKYAFGDRILMPDERLLAYFDLAAIGRMKRQPTPRPWS